MELLIVTGQSGAGKTRVINALEDIGFYCVDNIPPALLGGFSDLAYAPSAARRDRTAIVIDARSGKMFRELPDALAELRRRHIPYRILFLEAASEVLLRRYKETRRRHPLLEECDGSLEDAIREERRLLMPIRQSADYVIDTTSLSPSQLRGRIVSIFEGDIVPMLISCLSFGFRNGLPHDADLVFDVRFLPNPFYVESMRHKSGSVPDVAAYIDQWPVTREFKQHLDNLVNFLIPQYEKEGKAQLVIAAGCTGGMHRSVFIANHIYQLLKDKGCQVKLEHRDLMKNEVWEHVREEV